MSAQPSQPQGHRRFSSRSGSRALGQGDVDIINRYSRKYSNTYNVAPYQSPAYASVQPSGRAAYNIPDSVSVASSQTSATARSQRTVGTTIKNAAHAKRPSNLISGSNHAMWNDAAMSSQMNDMESQMQNMIQTYQSRLEKQQHFMDEIQQEASQNKDFGKVENADNWSNLEVCHWLNTIHLDKYIQNFADQIIDGSILIRDLDETILVTELGVKKIHVKKIMREIAKLRQIAKLSDANTGGGKDALVESLKMEIVSLQRENKHLRDQIKTLQNQSQTHSNIQELASTATASHLSSNTSSMSSLPGSSGYASKYGSSSNRNGGYGMQSHNYTVNPRNRKYG